MRWATLTTPQAVNEIQQRLGEESISTDDEDLRTHGYSEWSSINIDRLPVAVAYPKSTEETAEIARICYEYKVPMSELLPRDQRHNKLSGISSIFRWIKCGGSLQCAVWWSQCRFHVYEPCCCVSS
jgi:hypothetical protein